MRQINPVGRREQFVASGVYTHYAGDNEPTGEVEYWSIHELPDKSHLIRVDWDGRLVSQTSVLSEALRDSDSHIERFNVRYYQAETGRIKKAKATYIFFSDKVSIGYSVDDALLQHVEMELPANVLVDFGGYLSKGLVISHLMEYAEAPVFSPDWIDDADDNFLWGKIDVQRAVQTGTDTLTLSGKPISAKRFQLRSIDSDDKSVWWLDAHHIPVQKTYDGNLSAVLTQYARRLEPKS
jgi:hypothetical protein